MQNKIVTLLYVSIVVACFAINPAQAAEVVIISDAKANPVKLNCSTATGPYVWKYNGNPIENANLSTYQVINSSATGNYSCESGFSGLITYEAISESKENLATEVVIISDAKLANPVKLNCSTATGPYVWKYIGNPIENANLSTYQVINSSATGNYSCESGLSGLITYEAINFAKPVIGHGEKSITVTEGDTDISLTCISKSSTPVTFYWKMENTTVLNTTKNSATKSVLTISEVFMSTRANYWCFAENAAGNANTTILVRVHSKLAPLWPFLGILAEVGLMTILTLACAKREKNKQKRNGRSAPLAQSNDTPQRGGSKEE